MKCNRGATGEGEMEGRKGGKGEMEEGYERKEKQSEITVVPKVTKGSSEGGG